MRYAKLIGEEIEFSPKKLKDGDTIIYNPLPDLLVARGYMPVQFAEKPEPHEGYVWQEVWSEFEGVIIQTWVEVEEQVSPEEISDALEGIL